MPPFVIHLKPGAGAQTLLRHDIRICTTTTTLTEDPIKIKNDINLSSDSGALRSVIGFASLYLTDGIRHFLVLNAFTSHMPTALSASPTGELVARIQYFLTNTVGPFQRWNVPTAIETEATGFHYSGGIDYYMGHTRQIRATYYTELATLVEPIVFVPNQNLQTDMEQVNSEIVGLMDVLWRCSRLPVELLERIVSDWVEEYSLLRCADLVDGFGSNIIFQM